VAERLGETDVSAGGADAGLGDGADELGGVLGSPDGEVGSLGGAAEFGYRTVA
jgi:hypothetical protein